MSFARQNPLLVFLIHMTQSIMLRQIAYLKAENKILRSYAPKQIQTSPAERALLVRLGAPLGNAIQELLSIAHYKTFLRWKREGMQPVELSGPQDARAFRRMSKN